jgi:hypothetical protein
VKYILDVKKNQAIGRKKIKGREAIIQLVITITIFIIFLIV